MEHLEDRQLLTLGTPAWIEQGPGPAVIEERVQDQMVSGAVNAIAAHPGNADLLFVGTVNGGIWKTENATAASPEWTPTTDHMPSLAIVDLAFSPIDCDPTDVSKQTCETLYAGTGSVSSLNSEGGLPVGLYKTTDGGTNWMQIGAETFGVRPHPEVVDAPAFGLRIRDVVPTQLVEQASEQQAPGQVVLVGTDARVNADGSTQNSLSTGIYRSTDGGSSWDRIQAGLPGGETPVSDLIPDRADPNRFYAAAPGHGVFISNDGGRTWTSTANDQLANLATTERILLSVHNSLGNNVVYAGLVTSRNSANGTSPGLESVYRSTDQGTTWTALPAPRDNVGVLHSSQGHVHFSIAADVVNPNVVYVGGASQLIYGNNGCGWSGRHLRGDYLSGEWTGLECTVDDTSTVHPDSRTMVFDANGNLLEGNDGAIYRLTDRDDPTLRRWNSISGNINSFETISAAYDSLNDVIIAGSQDTGTPQQGTDESERWTDVSGGDGQTVHIDNQSQTDFSIRYFSSQSLGGFTRTVFDASNRVVREERIPLIVSAENRPLHQLDLLPFQTLFELNTVDAAQMLIASAGAIAKGALAGSANVYESFDQGNTLTRVAQDIGEVTALAYGGNRAGTNNSAVAYVGTDRGLRLRTMAAGTFDTLPTYLGSTPTDIVLDPDDWQRAYLVDSDGRVWRTTDAGATPFTEITSNLSLPVDEGFGVSVLHTIEILAKTTQADDEVIFVGGAHGVYATDNPHEGTQTRWIELGTGLPNVPVRDLRYDQTDNLLLAATLGRGVWMIPDVSNAVGSQAPALDLNGEVRGVNFSTTFPGDGSAVPIVDPENLTVTDEDSDNLSSLRISLTRIRNGASEQLDVDTTGTNITKHYATTRTSGVLTLTGNATLSDYQQVLRTITYQNAATNPVPTPRTVTFVARDGTNNSRPVSSTIRFLSTGPAPFLDLNGPEEEFDSSIRYVEDSGPILLAPTATLMDADSSRVSSAVVSIFDCAAEASCQENESLAVDTSGTDITAAYDAMSGTLTLTGIESIANYEQVLRTVSYTNNSQLFKDLLPHVEFLVNDGTNDSNTASANLALVNVNDAPVLDTTFAFSIPVPFDLAEGPVGINEDDVESDFFRIGSTTDEVIFSAFDAGDDAATNVYFDPDLVFDEPVDPDAPVDVAADGYPGLAVVGVENTNGTWQFTIDFGDTWRDFDQVSEANAVLLTSNIETAVRFVPDPDFFGTSGGLSFRVWDETTANPRILEQLKRSGRRADTRINGGTTPFSFAIGTVTVKVHSVNDEPTFIAGPNQHLSLDAGPQTVSGWATNIAAGPDNESSQTVAFQVTSDNEALFAVPPSVAADGTLSFTPAPGAIGSATLSVRLKDDGGTENGGQDSTTPQTFQILVALAVGLPGDANQDGLFNSSDLTLVLQAGKYETAEAAAFSEGDWNGDGVFDSRDLVAAFQAETYVQE